MRLLCEVRSHWNRRPWWPSALNHILVADRIWLGRLVVSSRGSTPSRQHVLTVLTALEQRSGVRAWSYHSLRHYFCSKLIRRGASIEAVRLLAGHSKLDVTQRYVHANAADLRAAIATLTAD